MRLEHFVNRFVQVLQTEGHPKWRDVDLALPLSLGTGWLYYAPVERVLRSCVAAGPATPAAPAPAAAKPGSCGQTERVLGICR